MQKKNEEKRDFSSNRELFASKLEKKINDELQNSGTRADNETKRFFKTSKNFKVAINPVEKKEDVKIFLGKKKYLFQDYEHGVIVFYPNTEEFFEKGNAEEYFENERVAIKNFLKERKVKIVGKGNKGQYHFSRKSENISTGSIIIYAQNPEIAKQIKSWLLKSKYSGSQSVEISINGKEVEIKFKPEAYQNIDIEEHRQDESHTKNNDFEISQPGIVDTGSGILSSAVELVLHYGKDIMEIANKIAQTEAQAVVECFKRFFEIENLVLEREGIKRKKDTMIEEPGQMTFISKEVSNEDILEKITQEISVQYGPKPEELKEE